jgi:ubiquinone/menaquinone biosynthesis C-methylase UbiE
MDNLSKEIVESLDGSDPEIFPFLPYLLQDLFDLGSIPQVIIEIIKKHKIGTKAPIRILDLGCGKGAVSIFIAQELGHYVHGIDAMPSFIEDALKKAEELNLHDLCRFEVGDIKQRIQHLNNYDMVILGSIGPVFGNLEETVESVQSCIKTGGYVIIDDGYIDDNSSLADSDYLSHSQAHQQLHRKGIILVDEVINPKHVLKEINERNNRQIKTRVEELKSKYPNQADIFDNYLKKQFKECDILENKITPATWLLKKII